MDDLDRMFRRLVQNIRMGYPDLLSRPFEVAELYQNIIPYRHNRSELGLEQNQDYEFALLRLLSGERGYLVVDDALRDAMQRELSSPNPETSAFRAFAGSHVSLSGEAVRRLDQYLAGGARPDDARLARTAPRIDRPVRPETADRTMAAPPPPPPPPPVMAPPPPPMSAGSAPSRPAPPPPAAPPVAPTLAPPPMMPPSAPAPRAAPPPPAPRSLEADAAAATMALPTAGSGGPPAMRADGGGAPPRQAAGGGGDAARAGAGNPGGAGGAGGASGPGGDGDNCRYCGGTLPAGRRVTFCPHCGQNLTVQHCPACSTELEVGWKYCITCGRSVGT